MRSPIVIATVRPIAVAFVGALAVLAVATILPRAALGQGASYAIRYQGTLFIGNVPAPQGTQITVISSLYTNPTTVCGTGTVSDQSGDYQVDIALIPDACVQRTTGQPPSPAHIFLVNGENLATIFPDGSGGGTPTLDNPASLGHTETVNLTGTPVAGLSWTGGSNPPQLMTIRYYGTLSIGNVLAPQGTTITVLSAKDADTTTVCGTGAVNDNAGHYYIDVALIPDACVQRTTGQPPSPAHIFLVNGENLATIFPDGSGGGTPIYDTPASLAHTEMINLTATAIPNLTWSAGSGPPTLLGIRYYGTLTVGNSATPAPKGTQVTVTGTGGATCGTGAVNDAFGHFYVDVATLPTTCILRTSGSGSGPQHTFVVASQDVATIFPDGSGGGTPIYDTPASLAHTEMINLNVPALPSLTLSSPTLTVSTGGDGLLTATISQTQLSDTVLALGISDTTVVSVPPTVVIPANATSATIVVTAESVAGQATITTSLPPTLGGGTETTVVVVCPGGSANPSGVPAASARASAPTSCGQTSPPLPPQTCGPAVQYPVAGTPVWGEGWSMKVEVSARSGLTLRDVTLGTRYMAAEMSLPYIYLQTNQMKSQRFELTPAQLIDIQTWDKGTRIVRASYGITTPAGSCLVLTQDYEFDPAVRPNEGPVVGCEPSMQVPCARFRPEVKYTFQGQNGERLVALNAAQRMQFQVDGRSGNAGALFQDCDGNPGCAGVGQYSDIFFRTMLNPLPVEWLAHAIIDGSAGNFDNYHQTYNAAVSEPSPGPKGRS